MASGVPVLAADATSLPEVAGDAGVLFPPHGVYLLCDALREIIMDLDTSTSEGTRGSGARRDVFMAAHCGAVCRGFWIRAAVRGQEAAGREEPSWSQLARA